MGRTWRIVKRTGLAFYDDQMTHHAAALTYYALMSLFPAMLLGASLLGLLGQYPETYDALVEFLADVAPASTVDAIDGSLREAIRNKGTAATAFGVALLTTLYGSTGVLEAARRALNVAFEAPKGRSFLRRKSIDVGSTFVLMALVLVTLVLVFVGGRFARQLFVELGLGTGGADVWAVLRWPAAVVVAMLAFSWVYYVTPDVRHRSFRWVTPGAAVGIVLWLLTSYLFSYYVTKYADVTALYGVFAAAIIVVFWLWLSSAALLFGAELNAEIEREKQMSEGVPPDQTLALPARGS